MTSFPIPTDGHALPPNVSEQAFMGVLWGGFALATIFVLCRFVLRFKALRRFYVDDAFAFTAWIIILSTSTLCQIIMTDMYLSMRVFRGEVIAPPDFVPRLRMVLKGLAGFEPLFFTALWSIKLSFLFFFRRMYPPIGRWNHLWWAIFAFTIASWCVCIGDTPFACMVATRAQNGARCSSAKSQRSQNAVVIVNCVLDVITDVLITCIPFTMLWKVRISMRRKYALAGVFSVTIITIVSGIVRASLVVNTASDFVWLVIWSNVEVFTAIIVASLGSFRSLLQSQDSKRSKQPQPREGPPTFGSPARRRIQSYLHITNMSTTNSISDMELTKANSTRPSLVTSSPDDVHLPPFQSDHNDLSINLNRNTSTHGLHGV